MGSLDLKESALSVAQKPSDSGVKCDHSLKH